MHPEALSHAPLRIATRQQGLLRLADDLKRRIEHWLQLRRASDVNANGVYIGRHDTQLKVLSGVLLGAATALREQISSKGALSTCGETYAACREYQEALVWLERLWLFLRSRFDQRDGEGDLRRILRAADEVIWSCYRPVFQQATGFRQGPVPLAFVEPQYSPAAMQYDRPLPPDLRLNCDIPELDAFLQRIPLPLLRLPPWCVTAPWWLIFIGHEVGHHIQHELGLVDTFANGLADVVWRQNGPAADAHQWAGWGQEVFADAFSLVMMGQGALWAITEMEWSPAEEMAERKKYYPSPAVRLGLMWKFASTLGLPTSSLVPCEVLEKIAAGTPESARDFAVIDAVVEFLRGNLSETLGNLENLASFNAAIFARGRKIDRWGESLRGIGQIAREQNVESARHIASGALRGWEMTFTVDDPAKRESQREALATATPPALEAAAAMGVRSTLGNYEKPLPSATEWAEMLKAAGPGN